MNIINFLFKKTHKLETKNIESTCRNSNAHAEWPQEKPGKTLATATQISQHWIASQSPPKQLLEQSSTPTNWKYISYRNPNLQACVLTYILYRVKVRTHNGNVIDALLLEYKIISKPWVFGPWVKESPILNKVPIQLVHCGHQWGHQHYGHPQGCGLPWVGDPSPGCHHGRDVLPQIRQVVHITFVQPSPCTLPNTKIYVR